ncbi:hypothetical protein V493_08250 [Pseudogymnoascus sp. VKM F-4281 (FW-2241)]|nr:hypothetical protein V493_08250 [Pseudogymnoascus sp. VKM F-4281 (FW-2241)]
MGPPIPPRKPPSVSIGSYNRIPPRGPPQPARPPFPPTQAQASHSRRLHQRHAFPPTPQHPRRRSAPPLRRPHKRRHHQVPPRIDQLAQHTTAQVQSRHRRQPRQLLRPERAQRGGHQLQDSPGLGKHHIPAQPLHAPAL